MRRGGAAAALILSLGLASPAAAQPEPAPPPDAGLQPWPYPAPDPKTWWADDWPAPTEAQDPLAGRKFGRRERATPIDNGIDPTLYRLWGLPPLQWQVLRGDEMILEVWTRHANSVRQTVTRIVVRRDGRAFVQGRAGLACCEPGIARRVRFDAELPQASAATFLALRADPVWETPRDVEVVESGGSADALCVDGVSYDLTLLVPGQARSLRRACDDVEIGQVAGVLEPMLRAALGHDTRFDAVFPRGADFSNARRMYQSVLDEGGALKPAPTNRAQAPSFTPEPELRE